MLKRSTFTRYKLSRLFNLAGFFIVADGGYGYPLGLISHVIEFDSQIRYHWVPFPSADCKSAATNRGVGWREVQILGNPPFFSIFVWGDMNLKKLNKELDGKTASERIEWSLSEFNNVVMTTSFGIQSAVCLHLVTQQKPDIPVIFLDTGYLFPETYSYANQLILQLSLNYKIYRSKLHPLKQEMLYGKLWEQGLPGLELYNQLNKIEPMERALKELNADLWISGIRRVQSESRKNINVLMKSEFGVVKLHPIFDWTDNDVDEYIKEHNLPYHPLHDKGYVSVGDYHSSEPLKDGLLPEDTRFFGLKRECGLHE